MRRNARREILGQNEDAATGSRHHRSILRLRQGKHVAPFKPFANLVPGPRRH
jgi:hypothetical protein